VATTGLEVEPNDAPGSEVHVQAGRLVVGRVSGTGDRDLIRVDPRRAVEVRVTGDVPLAVAVLGRDEAPKVVEPGEGKLVFPPGTLGEGPDAILEIALPRGEGAEATARLVTWARGTSTYEVRVEAAR
jgi:hypothetical protein